MVLAVPTNFVPSPPSPPSRSGRTPSPKKTWEPINSVTQGRTDMLARILAANYPIPIPDAIPFINPISEHRPSESPASIRQHLGELLHPGTFQDSTTPTRFDLHEKLLDGLAHSLHWLFLQTAWNEDPFYEKMALQAILPLYTAASLEPWESCVGLTTHRLRRLAAFALWCQALPDRSILQWLESADRGNRPPQQSIQQSFQICINRLADRYWQGISRAKVDLLHSSNGTDAFDLDLASWEMTQDLLGSHSAQTVLESSPTGERNREGIRRHWNQLTSLFASLKNLPEEDSRAPIQYRNILIRYVLSTEDEAIHSYLGDSLQRSRQVESPLSLVIVRNLESVASPPFAEEGIPAWGRKLLDGILLDGEIDGMEAYFTESNELLLTVHGLERSEITNRIREALENLPRSDARGGLNNSVPLVAGIAIVASPNRAFEIEGFVQSALKCLEAASSQGGRSVKSIQVY